MMSKKRVSLLFAGCLILSIGFWYSVFGIQTSDSSNVPVPSNYTDSLSGKSVNKDAINDVAVMYPLSPYFIGFDDLQQHTLPDSDVEWQYVQDFMANYVMEHTAKKPSAVSFVKNSLQGPNFNADNYETTYSFKFGINNTDIRNVSVVYNPITPTITISISQNSKIEASKTFTVYFD